MLPEDHEKDEIIVTRTIMHVVVETFLLHIRYLLAEGLIDRNVTSLLHLLLYIMYHWFIN